MELLAKGHWPGDFETLNTIISQFSELQSQHKYGQYSCRFTFETYPNGPMIMTQNKNEAVWMCGTSWGSCDHNPPLIEDYEEGKAYYPAAPWGKVFATNVASGARVELWHDAQGVDPEATRSYLGELYQVLVEDGLQPTKQQKGQDTAIGDKRIYTPQIAEEITGRFSFDFLDAAVRKAITNFPYPWECPSRIEGKSAVYMLRDNNDKIFMAITIEPHISNNTFMVSIGKGTQNELIDDTKLASVHNQLYQSLVDAMYAQAFAFTPADSKRDKSAGGYDDTAVTPTVTNIYNVGGDYNKISVGDISNSTGIAIGTGASANIGGAPGGNYGDTAVPTPNDSNLSSQTGQDANKQIDLVNLADALEKHFSKNELDDLCFRLGVDDENVPGDTKRDKARGLVKYLDRRGRIEELIKLCQQERPELKEKFGQLLL
ncbi:MAG: hypothetical protein H6667_07695 [Ardenticatenaceae bacterium]|nr:hypothetical protein [Ardenticatenaceae bacterium]